MRSSKRRCVESRLHICRSGHLPMQFSVFSRGPYTLLVGRSNLVQRLEYLCVPVTTQEILCQYRQGVAGCDQRLCLTGGQGVAGLNSVIPTNEYRVESKASVQPWFFFGHFETRFERNSALNGPGAAGQPSSTTRADNRSAVWVHLDEGDGPRPRVLSTRDRIWAVKESLYKIGPVYTRPSGGNRC